MDSGKSSGNKGKRLTLADIAREANVSPATASLALNDSPLVASKTVRLVKGTAMKRGYSPHSIARRLSTGRSEVISLYIFTDDASPAQWILPSSWMFYNPIIKGIYDVVKAKKYHLQLEIANPSDPGQTDLITRFLYEKSCDGVIFLLTDERDYGFAESLERTNTPLVSVNHRLTASIPSVMVDNCFGARYAVNYFIKLGHRRIAHIAGPDQSYNAVERHRGYKEALAAAAIEAPNCYVRVGDWTIESGRRAMGQLIDTDRPPTAVFCSNDHMAIGALEAARDRGLDVPGDISLIGFDDSEISHLASPKLTTFRQPLDQIGQLAATEVLEPPKSKRHIKLRPLFVERESCAAPAGYRHSERRA